MFEHWRTEKLEKLIDPERRLTYGILKPDEPDNLPKLMIRTQDYTYGWVGKEEILKVSSNLDKEYKRSRVNAGDIVLTVVGNNVGISAIVPHLYDGANISRAVARIALRDTNCIQFYYQLLKSTWFKKFVFSQQTGGAQPVINLKALKTLDFPCPPLPEQRKIAKILSTWDKAISSTERLINNSKQQKKALMQQLLTGKKRLLDESGKPFEGEFDRVNLSELATIDKSSLGKKTPEDFEFSYISLSDVETGKIAGNLEKHFFASSPSRARRKVNCGDILLATVRPNLKGFAKVKAEHDGMIASTGFSVLTPKKDVSGDYLYHYLFSCHITGQINALVVGSNYPAINSSDVSGLKVYIPCYDEQKKIAKVLNNADESLAQLEQQLADLKQEKKALMQQLLTGKRRVKINSKECVA